MKATKITNGSGKSSIIVEAVIPGRKFLSSTEPHPLSCRQFNPDGTAASEWCPLTEMRAKQTLAEALRLGMKIETIEIQITL